MLLILMRGNVGTDTSNYLNYFGSIKLYDLNLLSGWEPGFVLISYFLSNILDLTPSVVMAIINAITGCFLFIGWRRTESNPMYFLLLIMPVFYIELTFDAVRLGLGLSLASIGLCWVKKDIKKFLLFVVVGAFFHYSETLPSV